MMNRYRLAVLGIAAALLVGVSGTQGATAAFGFSPDRRGGGGNGGGGKGKPTRPVHVRNQFRLTPTEAGQELELRGKAETEFWSARGSRPARERLTIQVTSPSAEPGTVLGVWFVNPANSTAATFLGDVTLVANPEDEDDDTGVVGRLRLDTSKGDTLPEGVSPVRGITEFRVVNGDPTDVLLQSVPKRRGR
jgi:hypothetical protein